MPIKSVKMKISKNKKMRFFLMSQGSLDPKIRFLGQKLWSVARVRRNRHTDRQTDRQTRKWKQRAPFHGFRSFSFNLSSMIGPILMAQFALLSAASTLSHYHIEQKLWFILTSSHTFNPTHTYTNIYVLKSICTIEPITIKKVKKKLIPLKYTYKTQKFPIPHLPY